MNTILKTAKAIVGWLLVGLSDLKAGATPAVLKYIELLERLATKGIGIPLAVAAVACIGYGITTTFVDILQDENWTGRSWPWIALALLLGKTGGLWSGIIALAGIVSFVYAWLCAVLASPVGVLAHASVPGARSVPSEPVAVSWGTLPSSFLTEIRDARIGISNAVHTGVEKYVHQMKFVLTFIGLTYLFAGLFPSLRGSIFLFILGALILTAMREFRNPVASVIRFAVCMALLWCAAENIFPALNPFTYYFKASPREVTMVEVTATTKSFWDFVNSFFLTNWTKPAFWPLLIAVMLFGWVAYRALLGLGEKVSGETAEAVSHTTTAPASNHTHGGTGSNPYGWLKVIAVVLVIVGIGWLIANSMLSSWNLALERRQNQEVRQHTIAVNEAVRAAAAAAVPNAPSRNGGGRVTSEPSPAPVMASPSLIATSKLGLQNPKGYVLALSTNRLSLGVPCPPKTMCLRIEPEEVSDTIQIFVDGMKWDRVPGVRNIVPGDAKFFQYLTKDPSTTNIIVWVGKQVTTRR